MKIIKKGVIPSDAYKMECRYCKAVFEFTKSETNVVFDQRDGNFMQLKCPCCSKDLTCNVQASNTPCKA